MSQELFITCSGTASVTALIPLKEDIPVVTTYTIGDIVEPDKRKGSGTKTITIPGTNEVNQLFGYIFEVGIDGSFNPNLKADCVYYYDSIPLLTGIAQLLAVNINNGAIEYEIAIYSSFTDIFSEWGDTKLEDLDLSEYDHNTTDKTVQWASTGDTIKVNGSDTLYSLGTGYVYPNIDYGGVASSIYRPTPIFHANDLYPAIYAKTYLDKAFSLAGYQYSSAFFSGSFFSHLIVPYSGGSVRPQISITLSAQINVNLPSQPTQSVTGWYRITNSAINIVQNIAQKSQNFGGAANATLTLDAVTVLIDPGSSIQLLTNIDIEGGGGTITMVSSTYLEGRINNDATSDGSFKAHPVSNYTGIDIALDHIIQLNGETYDNGGNFDTTIYTYLTPDTNLSNYIPKNIKIRDFFKWLILMFNLYVKPDKDNPKLLIIEPYASFWDSGKTVDWSNKLDVSKEIKITPVAELNFKNILFSYKEDSDYLGKDYKDQWQEIFGQYRAEIINDFLKNEKKIEVGFSPTPLLGLMNGSVVIPVLVKDTPKTSTVSGSDGTPKDNSFKGNIRILYWGGRKSLTGGNTWTHKDGTGTISRSQYGYAGHFDDPYAPTLDINFGVLNEVYYTGLYGNYTTNNLYNAYYSQYIDEIGDKDSKLIEAFFYLNAVDIQKLDFQGYVFFDKYLCKIQEIIDYNATSPAPTRIKLLKIKNGVPFTAETTAKKGRLRLPDFGGTIAKQTNLNNLQVATMGTPVTILDAPGADLIIDVVSITSIITDPTTPYTTNTTLAFKYESSGGDLFTDSNVLGASSDTASKACGASCSGGQQLYPNEGIVAYVQGGNPEAGDGDLSINILYRILRL